MGTHVIVDNEKSSRYVEVGGPAKFHERIGDISDQRHWTEVRLWGHGIRRNCG